MNNPHTSSSTSLLVELYDVRDRECESVIVLENDIDIHVFLSRLACYGVMQATNDEDIALFFDGTDTISVYINYQRDDEFCVRFHRIYEREFIGTSLSILGEHSMIMRFPIHPDYVSYYTKTTIAVANAKPLDSSMSVRLIDEFLDDYTAE